MSGKLIISLDFELMWGVRDRRAAKDYGDAILGGREAIPKILEIFKTERIRATWATVGLLFSRDRNQMLEFAPRNRPNYVNKSLSPYSDIEDGLIGFNEKEDPLHFGASLVDQIAETPGQEISTHTYSHYYCLEPRQDLLTFQEDLVSAIEIAKTTGHDLKSIVFPRNQVTDAHIQKSADLGISVYRGEAKGKLYRPRSEVDTGVLIRLARFMDGAIPIGPAQVSEPGIVAGAINVPASRFLRPWTKKSQYYNALHIRRIESEMELAAQSGRHYHLWWHPHNFGRNTEQNLLQLQKIIKCYKRCRNRYGLESCNMQDISTTHLIKKRQIT